MITIIVAFSALARVPNATIEMYLEERWKKEMMMMIMMTMMKAITRMTIIMKMIRMMTLMITIIVASSALPKVPNATFEI